MDIFGWRRRRVEIEAAIRVAKSPDTPARSSALEREFEVLLQKAQGLRSRSFAARADARRAWLDAGGPRRSNGVALLVAATACVTLWVAGTYGWRAHAPQYRTVLASNAHEQSSLALPDGSVVHLNVGSDVEIRYFAGRREVELRAGEAYFDVARDPARSFEVIAADLRVRVTGTQFDVRLLDNMVQVGVREGVVRVSEAGSQTAIAMLEAGRSIQVAAGRIRLDRQVPPDHVGAWKDGILALYRTPLAEMVREVARYHPERKLEVDPTVAGLQVSGAFRIADLNGLLEAVRLALPVQVAHSGNAIRIVPGSEADSRSEVLIPPVRVPAR